MTGTSPPGWRWVAGVVLSLAIFGACESSPSAPDSDTSDPTLILALFGSGACDDPYGIHEDFNNCAEASNAELDGLTAAWNSMFDIGGGMECVALENEWNDWLESRLDDIGMYDSHDTDPFIVGVTVSDASEVHWIGIKRGMSETQQGLTLIHEIAHALDFDESEAQALEDQCT